MKLIRLHICCSAKSCCDFSGFCHPVSTKQEDSKLQCGMTWAAPSQVQGHVEAWAGRHARPEPSVGVAFS
jgi:hypothetical protein